MHFLVLSQETVKPTRDALITLAPHTLYCNMLLSTVLYAGMRERGREVGACHQGEKACNRRSRHEREAPAQTTCIQ